MAWLYTVRLGWAPMRHRNAMCPASDLLCAHDFVPVAELWSGWTAAGRGAGRRSEQSQVKRIRAGRYAWRPGRTQLCTSYRLKSFHSAGFNEEHIGQRGEHCALPAQPPVVVVSPLPTPRHATLHQTSLHTSLTYFNSYFSHQPCSSGDKKALN